MTRPRLFGRDDIFGPALTRCIQKRGRTLRDVAEQYGYRPDTLRHTLRPNPKRSKMSSESLLHIMQLLGITPQEILAEGESYLRERELADTSEI